MAVLFKSKRVEFVKDKQKLFLEKIQKKSGLNPRFTRGGRNVRIDSQQKVASYFKLVGTHNEKHARKINSFFHGGVA